MTFRFWTGADEKRLTTEYLDGTSLKEIGNLLNRPETAISKRISRMIEAGRLEKRTRRKDKDLSGRKFGERTVLKRDPKRIGHWIMECSCGNLSSVHSCKIGRGERLRCKSCAARGVVVNGTVSNLKRGGNRIDRAGHKYGYWTVLEGFDPVADNSGTFLWVMQCVCGTIRWKLPTNLRRKTKTPANCGCKRGYAPNRNELALIPGMRVRTIFKGLS